MLRFQRNASLVLFSLLASTSRVLVAPFDSVPSIVVVCVGVGIALVAVAALLLADAVLTTLALVPPFAGAIAALVVNVSQTSRATAIAATASAFGVLVTSLWLVRTHPRQADKRPRSWLPIAVTLAAACGSLVVGADRNAAAMTIAITMGVGALAQGLLTLTLQRIFHRPWPPLEPLTAGSAEHVHAVLDRYVYLPPTIRYWARGKLRFDPLFRHLGKHLPMQGRWLDLGCGYGLPATWLATLHPRLHFRAVDAVNVRVRIASHVLDRRADVTRANIESWIREPSSDPAYDGALCIDVLHHLRSPRRFLDGLARRLDAQGVLLLRTTVSTAGEQGEALALRAERWMVRLRGQRTVGFYTEQEVVRLLTDAGFEVIEVESPPPGKVGTLFVAHRRSRAKSRPSQTDSAQSKLPRTSTPLGEKPTSTAPASGSDSGDDWKR